MKNSNLKSTWLAIFCALVVLMIAVGGVTRLTKSGLSIVEWKPVSGIIPPITESDWQNQFELYKASPEYNQVNSHFGIEEYKNIFMWEYLHRVLGRLLFLFVLIPGIILWRKKVVTGQLVTLLAALIASQGLIGWLMVKSGLKQNPHVSPYMLALHFFSALIVLLVGYYHFCKERPLIDAKLSTMQSKLLNGLGVLLMAQVFWGCITSGMKAGFAFNTYPLMGGDFFPAGGMLLEPQWLNFFENPAAVQWTHRWLGILVFAMLVLTVINLKKSNDWIKLKGPMIHLMGIMGIQIVLGILNILLSVPTWLAIVHQVCGSLLVMTYFGILFRLKK